ncbi:nucleotidyltransferase family protein [Candidatus Aerophobetes bacterium]|nr:nucleotidyltransferase family protein [Candidatus Aerophobetes bacterium]
MLCAVLLAAGESKRMGSLKALLPLFFEESGESKGKDTFLSFILKNLHSVCEETILVLGYKADLIENKIVDLNLKTKIIINREYKKGQLCSLRVNIKKVSPDCEGIMLTLVDHPLVNKKTYRLLKEKFSREKDKIIIPAYKGKWGHPVIFSSLFFPDLMKAPLNQGARYVVKSYSEKITLLPVEDKGVILNIDTPENYQKFCSYTSLKRLH